MKQKAARERFGDVSRLRERRALEETSDPSGWVGLQVVEITKDDWVREVTEASKSCWVVVHLYQDRWVPALTWPWRDAVGRDGARPRVRAALPRPCLRE
jgi:hypothetical protein